MQSLHWAVKAKKEPMIEDAPERCPPTETTLISSNKEQFTPQSFADQTGIRLLETHKFTWKENNSGNGSKPCHYILAVLANTASRDILVLRTCLTWLQL